MKKRNFWAVWLIIFLTLITWHKVIHQVFLREGFLYFNYEFLRGSPEALLRGIFGYDTLARLMFEILPPVFGDNLLLYQLVMLGVICLFNGLFYLLVYELTGKRVVALMAAVFFTVNYSSSYEIFGLGDYTYFLQRLPHLTLALLSFWLLVRFLHGKAGWLTYSLSLGLWFSAVLMGLFSVFLLPLMVCYGFFFLWQKKKVGEILPFVFVGLMLVWLNRKLSDSLIADKSFFDCLFHNPGLIPDMAYQLTWLTLPLGTLKWFDQPYFLREPMITLAIPLSLFYLIAVWYLAHQRPSWRPLIYALVLSLPMNFFLNVYTRPTQIYYIYGSNRYLYLPSLAFAIFLAILLDTLFNQRKLMAKLFLLALVSLWMAYNLGLIWTEMNEQQVEHLACKTTLDYIKKNSKQFATDALVVLPDIFSAHGAGFCQRFYGREQMRFEPIYTDWEKLLEEDFDLNKLVVIDYDYQNQRVLDRSAEFREKLKKQ